MFANICSALLNLWAPILLLLLSLTLSVLAGRLRGREACRIWRRDWSRAGTIGAFGACLFAGVIFADILLGLHLENQTAGGARHGVFFMLFNSYALVCGIMGIFFFCLRGVLRQACASAEESRDEDLRDGRKFWLPLMAVALLFFLMTWTHTRVWSSYAVKPGLFLLPLLSLGCLVGVRIILSQGDALPARIINAAFLVLLIASGILGMILPLVS